MSIIRITRGNYTTRIEKNWNVYTEKFKAYAERFSNFTAEGETNFGSPDTIEISENAFIPVITPILNDSSYTIIIDEKKHWNFDKVLENHLRYQKSHEIKFTSKENDVKLKFKVYKGHSQANDSDGGNLRVLFFSNKGKLLYEKIIKNINYGNTFIINWNRLDNIDQIQFYADDNDWIFDGNIKNIFCGAVKLFKTRIQKIWEAYPKKDDYTRDEVYKKIGGYLKSRYDECKALPETDARYRSLDNTCAVRMSRALNYSGFNIPEKKEGNYRTYKGGDGKNYFITVSNIRKYLVEELFVESELKSIDISNNTEAIFIENDCGWSDATGHVDIKAFGVIGIGAHDVCKTTLGWTDLD